MSGFRTAAVAFCTFAGRRNSTRLTPATYRFSTARYLGASCCNSARHAPSGTSTRNTPPENSTARVRAATVEPQARGHAITAVSARGLRRRLLGTIFCRYGAIGSTERFDCSIRWPRSVDGVSAMRGQLYGGVSGFILVCFVRLNPRTHPRRHLAKFSTARRLDRLLGGVPYPQLLFRFSTGFRFPRSPRCSVRYPAMACFEKG